MVTCAYVIRQAARMHRARRAVVFEGQSLTFDTINRRSNQAGAAMAALGLERQERMALLCGNRPEVLEVNHGILKRGRVTVPLNARLSAAEHIHMLNETGARVLVYSPEFSGHVDLLRGKTGVERFVRLGGGPGPDIDYQDLISGYSDAEPDDEVSPDDIASLNYTSGTTGTLKAAVHTQGGAAQTLFNTLASLPAIGPDDAVLHVGPLTHAAGAFVHPFWWRGGTSVIMTGFEPTEFLRAVYQHQITHLFMVPTMIVMLLSTPGVEAADFSSLKTIIYGASPMPVAPLRQAIGLWGPKFLQLYGQTESPLALTMLMPEDHVTDGEPQRVARLASAGRPVAGVEVRIVDEAGRDVAPGEVGEIISRGGAVMRGYWQAPELTAETIVDGWVHSRDMARADDDGYVFIVDRKSDMIVSGGFNVYPREIEDVLYAHPKVLEACVIGVPDDVWVEAVKAVVVLREGEVANAEEIIAFCRDRVASYKKPSSVDFVAALPRNAYGKVLRRDLRAPYWGNGAGAE